MTETLASNTVAGPTPAAIEHAQRLRLRMCRNAFLGYLAYGAILAANIVFGSAPPAPAITLIVAELVAGGAFYVVIRSGMNLSAKDPSLTMPQITLGCLFTLWCYAVLGPNAPAPLISIGSQMIYTVFALPPQFVRKFGAAYLVGLALTMVVCHLTDSARYPLFQQLTTFAYALLVIPLISSLGKRVTTMSERLRANKRDLQDALAKVQQLATRDELTQIHNRRHLTELMETERAMHRRNGRPLCVALIDLDHFKQVNDRHGHKTGDEVLCLFAATAREVLRTSDLLGRWGGEEFLVMFPATDTTEATAALQRLTERLAALDMSSLAPGLPTVTFSAGLATLGSEESLDAAIERADEAMYAAKAAGRNRCVVG